MPQINLSNVSEDDLHRLLDASHRRGDPALGETIRQEMAARREVTADRRAAKAQALAAPRLVFVELDDLVAGPPQGAMAPGPKERPPRPRTPSDPVIPGAAPVVAFSHPVPLAGRRVGLATLALGVAAGMAVGWWAGALGRHEPVAAGARAVPPARTVAQVLPIAPALPAPPALSQQTNPTEQVREVRVAPANAPSSTTAAPVRARPAAATVRHPAPVQRAASVRPRKRPQVTRIARVRSGDPERLARLYEEGVRKLNRQSPAP